MTIEKPADLAVDRRAFLVRAAALAAVTTAGAVALPAVAGATGKHQPGLDSSNAFVKPRPEALADPTELTVAEAAWLIRERRLRPEDLLEAYLARIAAYDSTYQAFNV
ncbi:MAG TPA: amidase, partial [Asanoa sp.]|nr:amidase [Asanoa sp.]